MKASDVTKENICEVTTKQAFEWVKSGMWNLSQFQFWWHETTRLQVSCVLESVAKKAKTKA